MFSNTSMQNNNTSCSTRYSDTLNKICNCNLINKKGTGERPYKCDICGIHTVEVIYLLNKLNIFSNTSMLYWFYCYDPKCILCHSTPIQGIFFIYKAVPTELAPQISLLISPIFDFKSFSNKTCFTQMLFSCTDCDCIYIPLIFYMQYI